MYIFCSFYILHKPQYILYIIHLAFITLFPSDKSECTLTILTPGREGEEVTEKVAATTGPAQTDFVPHIAR